MPMYKLIDILNEIKIISDKLPVPGEKYIINFNDGFGNLGELYTYVGSRKQDERKTKLYKNKNFIYLIFRNGTAEFNWEYNGKDKFWKHYVPKQYFEEIKIYPKKEVTPEIVDKLWNTKYTVDNDEKIAQILLKYGWEESPEWSVTGFFKSLPQDKLYGIYFDLLNLSEIKVISKITPEMVETLADKINDKLYSPPGNGYNKKDSDIFIDIFMTIETEIWEKPKGFSFSTIIRNMNQNQLNRTYKELLKINILNEIKVISKITPEMIDDLWWDIFEKHGFNGKFRETTNKYRAIIDPYDESLHEKFRSLVYGITNQNLLNSIYAELLQLK